MRKSEVQHTEAIRIPSHSGTARSTYHVWTSAALMIALAIVIARVTMLETIREGVQVIAGEKPVRGAGPISGVMLDMLSFLPAMLILARRWLDKKFALRFQWSPVIFIAVAIWAAISVAWAGDRYVAAIGAAHWIAAAALMWAIVQIVTDWKKLRLVAGICFGLLLVYAAHGLTFQFVDRPDLVRSWESKKVDYFKAQGWDPDSFIAQQFDRRIRAQELFGFFASPNTFAAVVSLTMLISLGVVIQRFRDRDEPAWPALILLAMPLGLWLIWQTDSKGGKATFFLGAILFGVLALLRNKIAIHAAKFYWLGVGGVVAAIAAVIGHGVYHGNLVIDSLNFRWNYWIGSWRLFLAHPVQGVGWNNFGQRYLMFRLPVAAEEIKDPHNFLVRVMTELGAVGLVIFVAWMLRNWWEMTRPRGPLVTEVASPRESKRFAGIGFAAATLALGTLLESICSIDWRQSGDYVIFELFKRVIFFALLFGGVMVTTIRSSKDERVDDRPARWILVGVVIALGGFVLHCLIDFAMFETGPLFLFALLVGSVLGMRSVARERKTPRQWSLYSLIAMLILWIAAAGLFVAPVVEADELADQATDELAMSNAMPAMDHFNAADETLRYNYEYPAGAARAAETIGLPYAIVKSHLDRAVQIDPFAPELYAHRAGLELRQPRPDPNKVTLEYGQALRLNPNDVAMRLDYAQAIERLGNPAEALRQYRAALEKDDQLSKDEPKRLSPARVSEIKAKIDQLEKRK